MVLTFQRDKFGIWNQGSEEATFLKWNGSIAMGVQDEGWGGHKRGKGTNIRVMHFTFQASGDFWRR